MKKHRPPYYLNLSKKSGVLNKRFELTKTLTPQ